MPIYQLNTDIIFPNPTEAEEEGILAIGGDLSCNRLILAYQNGIFPWYNEGEEILWWSPDPRFVLFPEELKVSKSLRQQIKKGTFSITYNKAFSEVIAHCKKVSRQGQDGTWITEEMEKAYNELHRIGYAISAEAWVGDRLVGGLYGVCTGSVFTGESMFALESNASKVAFVSLVMNLQEMGFTLIDCQNESAHLGSFGARMITREAFLNILRSGQNKGSA